MLELLGHLEANGFSNYIASGGGRDSMRPISDDLYGIPRQRVIGSSIALTYTEDGAGGTITRKADADLDDGPEKPVRIWSRTGRRPLLAAGNSNGDVQMLHFTHHVDKPTLRLADPARRRRSRVRLHHGRRKGARTCPRRRLDHRQHEERLGHRLLTSTRWPGTRGVRGIISRPNRAGTSCWSADSPGDLDRG
jgi:hypothetical protein